MVGSIRFYSNDWFCRYDNNYSILNVGISVIFALRKLKFNSGLLFLFFSAKQIIYTCASYVPGTLIMGFLKSYALALSNIHHLHHLPHRVLGCRDTGNIRYSP